MTTEQLASLDREMQSVRAQIEALRRRQSLMSASLLTSRRTKGLIQTSQYPRQQAEKASRQSAIDIVDKAVATLNASTMRTTTGITAFRVKDPDPNAIADGNILGVRLDVYSTKKREYSTPYFLCFQEFSDGRLKLHQHTVPAFIPLRPLLRRYVPADVNHDDDGHKDQNLAGFVRAVRKELVSVMRRIDDIETLKEATAAASGSGQYRISAVTSIDPSAMDLELKLHNDAIIRIRLSSAGTIDKSSVRSAKPDDITSRRLIERAVARHTGCISGLHTVLENLES